MIIAFLSSSGELGGAERSLLDLVASIRTAQPGWEIHVVLPATGPLQDEAAGLGARTSVVELPPTVARLGDHGVGSTAQGAWQRPSAGFVRHAAAIGPAARYVWRLRKQLRQIGPAIVHTNGLKMHVFSYYAVAVGTPIVWHLRDFVGGRPLISAALRVHRGRCAAAIANSNAVAADVRGVLEGVEVYRVYNGVDLERFAPTGPVMDLDAAAGLPHPGAPVVRVGLVATFARWKGHTTFMKAISLLPGDASVRGFIVGGPLYATEGSQHSLAELKRIAAESGLNGKIGFSGHVDDSSAAIRALDIVVHASTMPEPFGRVIIEAMACGRAVLAADAGGASEVLADLPDSSYRPGDADQLARQITRLAASRELREESGRLARAVAQRRYDRRRLAEEVVPIYHRMMNRKRMRGGGRLTGAPAGPEKSE